MFRHRVLGVVVVSALFGGILAGGAAAQDRKDSAKPWTLEEARQELNLYPQDTYLQYVALQLARNEGKQDEVARQIRDLNRPRRGPERRVDLFALFSAAHAIQETLQLDAMAGNEDGLLGDMGKRNKETVRVSTLDGPTVKSHPWGKMLAAQNVTGKRPEVSPLALAVPEDQYFVRFDSVEKLLQVAELGDRWGAHMFAQTIGNATTALTSSRLKTQLAIQTDPLTRPFYDMVVDSFAMAGSDLCFRAGTDTTVLFAVKQPKVFRLRMDSFLAAAEQANEEATRTTGKVLGVDYVHVATPDRSVHVFSAYPSPDLHVRSNSKVALTRVIAAVLGMRIDGKAVPRLGDSTEFKYIRTLMPLGAEEEDGFIYLSDPFIRRIVGPELKLTSQRRMLCYNHLRMIGHGSLLFQTQKGRLPESLDDLAEAKCSPGQFGGDKFRCPDGGRYELAGDGLTAVCSHHGNAGALTPCCEVAVGSVTPQEAEQYREFVERYSRYWRRFFDPIAIRLKVAPDEYRAETIILPLIDNSLYTGLARTLGGEPEPLDTLPVPKRNIFSVATRFEKPPREEFKELKRPYFLRNRGSELSQEDKEMLVQVLYEGLGNQIGFHVYDVSPTFDFNLTQAMGEIVRSFRGGGSGIEDEMFWVSYLIASLNAPVYISAPVNDAELVDRVLERSDVYMAEIARAGDERGWFNLDLDFYRVPLGGTDQQVRCFTVGFGPVKWRMFYGRVGDGLYVASKRFIMEDLHAIETAPAAESGEVDHGPAAHAMVRIRPENWNEILPMFHLGWAEASRNACLNNLGPLSSVAKAVASTGGADAETVVAKADAAHAVHFFCPDGGKYELSNDGRHVACSKHGTALLPRQGIAPAEESPMGKLIEEFGGVTMALTFLEDGLHAVVTVDRK